MSGGTLNAQRTIIHQAASGWRPRTPQARGGQAPLAEPPTETPGPPLDWEARVVPASSFRTLGVRSGHDWNLRESHDNATWDGTATDAEHLLEKPSLGPWVNLPAAAPVQPLVGPKLDSTIAPLDAEASDHDSESTASEAEEAEIPDAASWCFLTNKYSGVSHVAQALHAAERRALAIAC